MDRISPEQRRKNMQAVRCKDTDIEVALRKLLWAKGYRYRKNCSKIYGKPDIAFPGKKVVVFCDSEFWHGYNWEEMKHKIHSNRKFWIEKIENNIKRDKAVNDYFSKKGWTILRFWGKSIKNNPSACLQKIESALRRDMNV